VVRAVAHEGVEEVGPVVAPRAGDLTPGEDVPTSGGSGGVYGAQQQRPCAGPVPRGRL